LLSAFIALESALSSQLDVPTGGGATMNFDVYVLAALEDHAKRWEEAAVKMASLFPTPGPEPRNESWLKERQKYFANAKALRELRAKVEEKLATSKSIAT
jgi:hypothetical protein